MVIFNDGKPPGSVRDDFENRKDPRVSISPDLDEAEALSLYEWTCQEDENMDTLLRCLEISLDPFDGHVLRTMVSRTNTVATLTLPAGTDKRAVRMALTEAIVSAWRRYWWVNQNQTY